MVFYYALHNTLRENEAFCGGKRNCATFLFGSVLYAITYAVLMNARIVWGAYVDSLLSALLLTWLADAATMAYTYRSYYGRTILHEIGSDQVDQQVFDESTHKYRHPTAAEKEADAANKEAEQRSIAAKREAEQRSMNANARAVEIREGKARIRAAKVIQRWWRVRLYDPPNGILYLRARSDFQEKQSTPPTTMCVSKPTIK